MKRPSSGGNVKKAVLLVGSGYGALKVAQDLAQSGHFLVWVTKAPHFLELPGGRESFTEWPEDLEYQFRPLYLRVTRHPRVTALTHARIESIDPGPDGHRVVVVQDPLYVDYDLCTGCGRCMEVCPIQNRAHPPLRRTPAYCPSRALDLDKRKLSPCRTACPLGVNVQAYMALTASSRFDEALDVIRRDNPLPGICGRVCHHPCEQSCRRADLDEAVAICSVKRFLADRELSEKKPRFAETGKAKKTERVAVIGAGPAGLTAAHYLNGAGFPVTIFEAHHEAGGMLRLGINAFRLPRAILDVEIQAVVESGVEIRTGTTVRSLQDLFDEGFQAVLVCTGAHRDLRLGIPGDDAEGVLGAVAMLRSLHAGKMSALPGHVAVIGGGNSAFDAARAAIRLGAGSVTIYYRRERGDMPASLSEIREAEEEGVRIEFRCAPVRIAVAGGKVSGLTLARMKMGKTDKSGRRRPEPIVGSEFSVPADRIIVAIGQQSHLSGLQDHVKTDAAGRVSVDKKFSASRPGVFAAGDVVTGPDTVVGSMAQGRQAAARVAAWLKGARISADGNAETHSVGEYLDVSTDEPKRMRAQMPRREAAERRRDFAEVETGFSAGQAVAEAQRCLQCSSCCECRVCESVCKDIGAIDHARAPRRLSFVSPAVIVASEGEIARRDILAQQGVYRVGEFKSATDIVNVLMAGSASAGQAMADCLSLRHPGIPAEPREIPDDREPRLGVFICTCNGTLASSGALERIRNMASRMPGAVHSELITSACHPRGAERIAAAFRSQRLSRVILASCVCCPLEFQCISCNDQRNRARIHLFNRLGLDRCRFETINIRDHLGSPEISEDEAVANARDFLREAFLRARLLGPLRGGTTKMGNRILILGGSEVGLSCAHILDLQGFKVRLVHRCRLKDGPDLPEGIARRPVTDTIGKIMTHVPEATIESIKGHLGDFHVTVSENGQRRQWKADIVCLTDLNLLPLAIPVDMFGLKKFYRFNFAFFNTPQVGVYRVMPRTLGRVSAFQAGAALAAHVATAAAEAFLKDHELSPRVDPERCRGCGRCVEICTFDAVRLVPNDRGFYTAEVLRHNCVGCGGCVGRCPVTAMDMPYFSNRLLEEITACTLGEDR
jgi:NADPH-dependent glutamate synthase beta subunit-like oxidoreductase/NAD-dependent dihydropyrimidine dehydrogenase PreA subunit